MNEFLVDISSPSWWIGVVIISFVINLGSAYAKKPLDRVLARFSTNRRKKLEQKQHDLTSMLETAKRHKDGMVLLSIRQLKYVFLGLSVFILSILSLLVLTLRSSASLFAPTFALVFPFSIFITILFLWYASKIEDVLKLYESSQTDNEP